MSPRGLLAGLVLLAASATGARATCVGGVSGLAVTGVGSTAFSSTWTLDTPANEKPLIVVATNSGFTPATLVSSGSGALSQSATTFNNLTPGGTYFLEVKLSTEAAFCGFVSTVTLPGSSAVIPGGLGGTYTLTGASGTAVVTVPAGSFPQAVTMIFDLNPVLPGPTSRTATLVPLGVGLRLGTAEGLQPAVPVTLTLNGNPPSAAGKDPSTFVVARYDDVSGQWSPLVSSYNSAPKTVTGVTTHFSLFQVMQALPAATPIAAKVFPNPLRPNQNQPLMSLTLLPAGATVRIFTLLGERVRELTANASGTALWDAKNDAGLNVASGLYLAIIESGTQRAVLKLAVER